MPFWYKSRLAWVLNAVAHRVSGAVYLHGQLERGIVPEDSVWEHGGGVGEEGCTLHLHKMNLELLRRCAFAGRLSLAPIACQR